MKEITQTLLASPFPNDKIYPTNIALVFEGFKGLVIESLIPGNKSWQQLSVTGQCQDLGVLEGCNIQCRVHHYIHGN